MAPRLNLAVQLLTRRKHQCPAIKNPLTDLSRHSFMVFRKGTHGPGLACRGARGQVPGEADDMVAARDDFGIMGGKHERAAVRRDA